VLAALELELEHRDVPLQARLLGRQQLLEGVIEGDNVGVQLVPLELVGHESITFWRSNGRTAARTLLGDRGES
jgi:hypothetical protein